MLLVGSVARNTGKTIFCTEFIARHATLPGGVTGVKITTIYGKKGDCHRAGQHEGYSGCGACSAFTGDFEITQEIDPTGSKDTNLLLRAGAKQVYWLRSTLERFPEAAKLLLKALPKDTLIVCESNSLVKFVKPGAIVVTYRRGVEAEKQSAQLMIQMADFTVDISVPDELEKVIEKIAVNKTQGGIAVSPRR